MRVRRFTLVAAVSLCSVGLLAPWSVPLYDGVGFPDEPYRFVRRPAGDTRVTKPPTAISTTVPVVRGSTDVGGSTDGFNAASAEQGPQVSIFAPVKTLLAPSGARRLTVQVRPRAPNGAADGGAVDANVYRFTATTDAGPPSIARGSETIRVILRATTSRQPGPIAEYRALGASTWSRLATSRYGTDVYAAPARGFGDYALVFAAASTSAAAPAATRRGTGRGLRGGLLLGGLVLVLAAVVVGIRVRRTRRAA